MNYQRIYNNIIQHRKSNHPEGYSERHHILPRSLGGSDDPSNLVSLTAKEHYICHYLLIKVYPEGSGEWAKMLKAFFMMKVSSLNQERHINGSYTNTFEKSFLVS